MANHRERGTINTTGKWCFDTGTISRTRQCSPGSIGLHPVGTDPKDARRGSKVHSYSISGNLGNLGWMFLTEAQKKLKGTWYDYTEATKELLLSEADLGMSEYADAELRRMAKRIRARLKNYDSVNANVHFEHGGEVETALVSGPRGSRLFRFDRKEAEKVVIPEGGDVLKPFLDGIDKIISLIFTVR